MSCSTWPNVKALAFYDTILATYITLQYLVMAVPSWARK
jgi:hypothetical protein